jgi:hypothetical protein
MSSLYLYRAATVFDFRPSQQVKELGITMKALWHSAGMRHHHKLPEPREVFSPTLEVLRISEASPYTPIFLKHFCAAKKGGRLPSLRHVEVYYLAPRAAKSHLQTNTNVRNQLHTCNTVFRQAKLELYLYFPGWGEHRTWEIGGTPWRLREEGALGQEEMKALCKLLEAQGLRFSDGYLDIVA